MSDFCGNFSKILLRQILYLRAICAFYGIDVVRCAWLLVVGLGWFSAFLKFGELAELVEGDFLVWRGCG